MCCAGTQHGQVLKLADLGVQQRVSSGGKVKRGAHYFKMRVSVPVKVSPEERSILKRLAALGA